MNTQKYNSSYYPTNSWNAPPSNSKVGLCLSGGGSRALAAGLGQLIGLKSISNGNGDTLLSSVDYISSVSGGSWLTSVFSFSQNKNLDDLLGVYTPPAKLSSTNIGDLPSGSIGQIPDLLSFSNMIDIVHKKIGFENIIMYPEVRKWVWTVIVGELVLKPYDLYQGSMQGSGKETMPIPKRFFSLDEGYMQQHIKSLTEGGSSNGNLTADDFYFLQSGRPFPVINTNIKLDYQQSDGPLLPVQATPVAIGATGTVPIDDACKDTPLTADGGVEAFAFTSTIESLNTQVQGNNIAQVGITRPYSLIDIATCSSAFFAQTLGTKVAAAAALYAAGSTDPDLVSYGDDRLQNIEESILSDLSSFVPQYNFWPVNTSASTTNTNTGFADGGNLDNTGLLGMLARTDATSIIVCYNSESPLGRSEDIAVEGYSKKVASISSDIPILFGYQPIPVNNTYVQFSDSTPADLQYLKAAQVFEPTEFGALVTALFKASNGQKSPTVAYTSALTVHNNSAAGISERGLVDVLWLYNNYASDWVTDIYTSDWRLADEIKYGHNFPISDFYNFPNYSTGLQIHLNNTQVNALAQFQAWVINQVSTQLGEFFS